MSQPRDPKNELAARKLSRLEDQLEAVRAIGAAMASAVGLEALLEQMVPQVSRLMRAQRTTLFFADPARGEIWSKVAQGGDIKEIRLKFGQGIAGWVAQERKPALVADAYDDPRFNREVDARTGFRTRSILAVPLLDRDGVLVGVVQVLNRKSGPFDDDDLDLLNAIAAQATYAVENARLAEQILARNRELDVSRQRAEQRRAELDLLYQLEQETSTIENLDDLLDSIIVRACEHLRSAAGSVFLVDRDTGRLFFRGVTGARKEELRTVTLAPGEGIVGWVAERGEAVIVNTPADDPRHARNIAQQVKYDPRALMCVPLVWDRRIIGAVEVLDPTPRTSGGAQEYDLEDLKMLTLIAGQVSRAVWLTQERIARNQTDRLAVVGRMLASVAHDLRNPMTVISGHAQLMATEADGQRRGTRCDKILTQIDEMTGMISDLLAFSRGDTTLRAGRVEVGQLASEIEDNLRTHCDPRGIRLEVAREPGHANVDIGRVKRIIYNVAKNAIDVLKHDDRLALSLKSDDAGLHISVSDTGPGMEEHVRSRLFEPFFTSGKAGGTGLGLSIVRRFVDDHSGIIAVESSVGKGTTFSITLPHARTPARAGVETS